MAGIVAGKELIARELERDSFAGGDQFLAAQPDCGGVAMAADEFIERA
jgi:hypothetical protein